MSMNRVCIMGRLTKAPELRRTQSGTGVVSFTLAVDDDFKDKQTGEKKAYFIDCVAWRNTAEFVCQYFDKGRMMVLDGHLQTREWQDKDGNKRKSVEVVADSVYFGDSKKERDSYEPPEAEYSKPIIASMAQDELEGELPF